MSRMASMPFRIRICCLVVLLGTYGISAWPIGELSATDGVERFWSFQPVRTHEPPAVGKPEWPRSPIDRFILAKLEEHGLEPSAPAGKRALLRRATFDLTGLPPTPTEIEQFLADESPEAFERVVDCLLASPRYGERWGRHWLDVVRYADARDLIQLPAESDFREAWRYRDWVVAAFNRDLPYDEFITRQIAGDLMQPADPSQIDAEALVATGLLAIADFVPGDVDKQQMIADYVNDQIDVVGRAFLGLTLACARCHDHKFDPISTEDYYSLAGIFFSTRLVPGPVKGNTPLVRVPLIAPAEIAAREAGQAGASARLAAVSHEIATLAEREYRAYLERRVASDAPRYLHAAWEFVHPPAGAERSATSEFAKERGLEEGPLAHWIRYFDEPRAHPALAAIRSATGLVEGQERVRALSAKLEEIGADRRVLGRRDLAATKLAEAELLRFRGDDRRVVTNEARQVTLWPNRGQALANAAPVPDVSAPAAAIVELHGVQRDVLRFTGKELLQVPVTVPPAGSLFVVYRSDLTGGAGQRLVGWEDSAIGQHGVGIMTDGAGSVHVIVRRNGAGGDVVVPAPDPTAAPPDFQILSISWGPAGVAVFRNGQDVGRNKEINSVSSDPAISALRIGGPGSGSSPRFQGDIAELRVYALPTDVADRARIEAELTARWCGAPENQETAGANAIDELYDELVSPLGPFQLEGSEREKSQTDEFRQRLAGLRAELEGLKRKSAPPDIPRAVAVMEGGPPGTPHEGFQDAAVYLRGNHAKPGKTVPRGVPRVIAGAEPPVIREGSGRRELARWLAHPANPLTARVMVNRVWQHHFGAGLVRTSANFGAMGERPTHPELLDDLAARFVASGWSVKALHRLIMLSSTYQQSSGVEVAMNEQEQRQLKKCLAVDPENRFLWRTNRRRLEAEAIRDSLLAVAGRLDVTPGGPGFQELGTPRRSLYLMSVRTGAKSAEFGPLFDAPDCSGIVERRNESIVAPQALFLMNDPLVTELATALAERVARDDSRGGDREWIGRLYEIAVGRPPVDAELEVGLKFLREGPDPGDEKVLPRAPGSGPARERWIRYCHLVLCTNEFLYVD
jgi:Protein of unknown function (DUF1553)/Protein of unknown function (DUF1549)